MFRKSFLLILVFSLLFITACGQGSDIKADGDQQASQQAADVDSKDTQDSDSSENDGSTWDEIWNWGDDSDDADDDNNNDNDHGNGGDADNEEEVISLDQLTLNLPEEYYIEMKVDSSSQYGSQGTSYAMSQADGWIYLKLGYDREQYVYKPISSGKYIEYKYDTNKKRFVASMISDALQAQIDAGNVPLDSVATSKENVESRIRTLDTYFCGYETLKHSLSYKGTEKVNGIKCVYYAGKVNTGIVKSNMEFWIDPRTGLVIRSINKTKAPFSNTVQQNDVLVYEEKGHIPSVD